MPFAKHENRKRQGKRQAVKGSQQGSNQSSTCQLCQALSKEELHAVEVAFLDQKPCQDIAAEHGVDEKVVLTHIHRCLMVQHTSRYARVSVAFDKLWEAIDLAHDTYMSAPTMYNGTSYQGLLKQLRALMVDLENTQNSTELGADLTQYAINPLITAMTNALISEAGGLKDDLTAKFDDTEAERMVSDFIKRLAKHFTQASQVAHDRILDTLTARDKNRMNAAGGPGRPKAPKGKHGNLRAVS